MINEGDNWAMTTRIWIVLGCIFGLLAGCQSVPQAPVAQTAPATSSARAAGENTPDPVGNYQLGAGDQIRLIVFNEDDLSGNFSVDDSGQLSLPLIGQVSAKGLNVNELETAIATSLKQGYLRNPRVSVEVLQYRPFYISGEVEGDGEYPYVVGLTVPRAVATAGGYTRRANKNRVIIIRAGSTERFEYPADQTTLVYPGDVIEIPERFF